MYCKYQDSGWCYHPDRNINLSNGCVGIEHCELEEFNAYDSLDPDDYTAEELDFDNT